MPYLESRQPRDTVKGSLVVNQSTIIARDGEMSLTGPQIKPSSGGLTDEENAKSQLLWNRSMCKEFGLPEGYSQGAVLIIKWEKKLDELNTTEEVRQVNQLFQDDFNYLTEIVELTNDSNPQFQLSKAIIKFVEDFDGPNNLLVVYYTGHAAYNVEKDILEFRAATNNPSRSEGQFPAIAHYDKADIPLKDYAKGDVVAILDTCYASNLMKNRGGGDSRSYELMAASGHGKVTRGPGPGSFTAIMIKSSKELLRQYHSRPSTIRQLCERINLDPARRSNQSHVWSLLECFERNIAIGPIQHSSGDEKKDVQPQRTRSRLSLSVPLSVERLSEEQIETCAREMSNALKKAKIPAKRINWMRLDSPTHVTSIQSVGLAMGAITKLKKKRKSSSNEGSYRPIALQDSAVNDMSDAAIQTIEDPEGGQLCPIESSPSASTLSTLAQKRKRCEEDDNHIGKRLQQCATPVTDLEHDQD